MSTTEAHGMADRREELASFSDWDALSARLAGVVEQAREVAPTREIEASFEPIEDNEERAPGPLGRYADARFRGFVGATFAADLACYAAPSDQVSFDRLLDAMRAYSHGFRLWGAAIAGAGWLPLGYTGVIPIAEETFARLERGEATLAGPAIRALSTVEPGGSFLYLFNFSIVPRLRGTTLAARVVKALADEVRRTPHRGLAAITVSRDGERVVERFGMEPRGRAAPGAHETVYTSRVA